MGFVRPASHRLDVDVGFVPAGKCEIAGHLQPQPGFLVKPSGTMQSCRTERPGWGGFFIAMGSASDALAMHAGSCWALLRREAKFAGQQGISAVIPAKSRYPWPK
jgi:hypothetical protein